MHDIHQLIVHIFSAENRKMTFFSIKNNDFSTTLATAKTRPEKQSIKKHDCETPQVFQPEPDSLSNNQYAWTQVVHRHLNITHSYLLLTIYLRVKTQNTAVGHSMSTKHLRVRD